MGICKKEASDYIKWPSNLKKEPNQIYIEEEESNDRKVKVENNIKHKVSKLANFMMTLVSQ